MKYKYKVDFETEFKRGGAFITPPKGIIIFDSYNNPWFPLQWVRLDQNKFSTGTMKKEFHTIYGGIDTLFMPWHYTVEYLDNDYYALSTRPITYKSLIPGYEEYISICIVGDSKTDVYSKELYKVLAHELINPLHYLQGWMINPESKVQYIELGQAFDKLQLTKNFR